LGENLTALNLITRLKPRVIIAARNRLGVINHTLLTIRALEATGINPKQIAVALMGIAKPDSSVPTNHEMLAALLPRIRIVEIPFLGRGVDRPATIRRVGLNIPAELESLLGRALAKAT
jgi:dethiobiotin synthetase